MLDASFIANVNFDSRVGLSWMAKSSKLVATRKGRVLLVRRRRDGRWMFPGGKRKHDRETSKRCLKREIKEELPDLRFRRPRLWREMKGTNPHSGKAMSDAIFVAEKVTGALVIGDQKEIDRAQWRKPFGLRLTPTSRFIRDQLFVRKLKSSKRN